MKTIQRLLVVIGCPLSVFGFATLSGLEPLRLKSIPSRSTVVFQANQGSFDVSASVPNIGTSTPKRHKINGVNGDSSATMAKSPPFPVVLWKFTRPHTLIGSALAVPALHLYAATSLEAALSVQNLLAVVYATVPSLLMNLYITGLNQVTDVEIDKINKPYLPIAAGMLSKPTAIATCLVALVASLTLGIAHPLYGTSGLNVALWGSGILGTLYSVKPFRLKRFPLLAAVCIVAVRGTIINAGFYAHAKAAGLGLGPTSFLSCLLHDPRCYLSTLFFGVFGLVIALMKDVPDVLGDRLSNIRTLSVRIGPHNIFRASRSMLISLFLSTSAAFAGWATKGSSGGLVLQRGLVAICSLGAALSLHFKAKKVDPSNPSMVYKYYMHLWNLFYLSYLVLPFAK